VTSLRVSPDGVSEATRRVHDEEVRELADAAFRGAVAIISTHRPKLDELATTLLENEVLERPDIDKIMHGVPRVAPERRSSGLLELAAAAPVPPPEPPVRRG
jgi:ATP-dependent Zn protease